MGNPVVHFEIHTSDNKAAGAFYAELFGWHAEAFPMGDGDPYVMIDTHAGGGINGGISHDDAGRVTFYIAVPSPASTLEAIGKSGGTTLVPETEIPNVVTFALFSDPADNVIGLVKDLPTGQEAPGVSEGTNPSVSWFEIQSGKPDELAAWYAKHFGWKVTKSPLSGEFVYYEVETGAGHGINGGIGSTPDGSSHVTVYAEVDDLAKYLERAEGLGGKGVMGPMDVGDELSVAAFQDPQGRVFGLYSSKH